MDSRNYADFCNMFSNGLLEGLKDSDRDRKYHKEYAGPVWADKKEATTMQVTYNGFTGELVKLERKVIDPESLYIDSAPIKFADGYELQIFTPDNSGIVAFTGVKLKDIKISGGAVTFD